MSRVRITPHALCGTVTPPASKSDAHRAILCAALADGESRVDHITFSEDIRATLRCVEAMGARVSRSGECLRIRGGSFCQEAALDCGESGSTLRFLMPAAAAVGICAHIDGKGRLPARPITVLTELLSRHGVRVEGEQLPLTISGRLSGGVFELPGDISSQYLSGLLFALPLIGEPAEIRLTSPLESAPYVDMTIRTMRRFGVNVTQSGGVYRTTGRYTPCDYAVEGDWSSAAFPIAAGALGGSVTLCGLNPDSAQGDREIVEIIRRFGAGAEFRADRLEIHPGPLRGIDIDAAQIPDMVPSLAVVAAFAKGDTLIHAAQRLRLKESDRLSAITQALRAVGIAVEEGTDSLFIHGGAPHGGVIDGRNDHRIVMAFSVLAAYASGESTVTDKEAAAKSYPDFFDDFNRMGGIFHVL